MARLMYGHVLANGLRINYYRTGGEKPPVVLLHGLSDYGLGWGRFPVFLEPGYDVVAIDLRGHGMSDKPESGYRYEDLAADALWVIRTLNLLKPVVIGHSLGAAAAAVFAETHAQYISGLVLEDPPWRMPDEGSASRREQRAVLYEQTLADYKSKSLQELIEICKAQHPNWDETEFLQWAKGKQLTSPFTVQTMRVPQRDWQDTVKNLRVPGLLLTADVERGAIITPETAALVGQHWKKGELVHLPGAGHNIHREQYYKYRDEVKRFLRKVY